MILLINSIITRFNNAIASQLSDEEKIQTIDTCVKDAQIELNNLNKDKKSSDMPPIYSNPEIQIASNNMFLFGGITRQLTKPTPLAYEQMHEQVEQQIKQLQGIISIFNLSKVNLDKADKINLLQF